MGESCNFHITMDRAKTIGTCRDCGKTFESSLLWRLNKKSHVCREIILSALSDYRDEDVIRVRESFTEPKRAFEIYSDLHIWYNQPIAMCSPAAIPVARDYNGKSVDAINSANMLFARATYIHLKYGVEWDDMLDSGDFGLKDAFILKKLLEESEQIHRYLTVPYTGVSDFLSTAMIAAKNIEKTRDELNPYNYLQKLKLYDERKHDYEIVMNDAEVIGVCRECGLKFNETLFWYLERSAYACRERALSALWGKEKSTDVIRVKGDCLKSAEAEEIYSKISIWASGTPSEIAVARDSIRRPINAINSANMLFTRAIYLHLKHGVGWNDMIASKSFGLADAFALKVLLNGDSDSEIYRYLPTPTTGVTDFLDRIFSLSRQIKTIRGKVTNEAVKTLYLKNA